ncbi:MAG: MFS transporter, partial [Bacteroidetes bacterium]|nr:MFS transporter [Bacteroidota bacterium]
ALNIATPFFTVFMMKTLGLPISYIIGLGILSQLAGIFTVRVWGHSSDKYSNKTVIAICGPLYIFCIIAWCFAGIYTHFISNLLLLAGIHIVTGISTAGINLALINIGLKLAPREQSMVYLSAKNIITAIFSSIAPIIGGFLADYFNKRHLVIDARWSGPRVDKLFHLISLHEWNFLFLIGAFMALLSLELLMQVKETGEVEKNVVVRLMRSNIKNTLKDYFLIGNLIDIHENLKAIIKGKKRPLKKEVANQLEQGVSGK